MPGDIVNIGPIRQRQILEEDITKKQDVLDTLNKVLDEMDSNASILCESDDENNSQAKQFINTTEPLRAWRNLVEKELKDLEEKLNQLK